MENKYAAQERRKKAVDLIWMNSDSDQWNKGISLLREALSLGDVDSYYYLGHCYLWGDGGLTGAGGKREGLRLYWEGAALGSSLCVIELQRARKFAPDITGECTKSLRDAFTEVMDLALNGDPFSCCSIGNCYFYSEVDAYLEMPKSMDWEQKMRLWRQEAKRWYILAGNLGVVCAMNNLAEIYVEEKNYNEALHYLKLAAARNNRCSYANLGRFYEFGIGVEKDKRQANAWYQKGAELLDEYCLWRIGCAWQEGDFGQIDYEAAHRCYLEALSLGNFSAAASLGREYQCGWGVERDYAKAVEYYLMNLESEENSDVPKYLGDIYCSGGYGVEADLDRAWHYYRRSAEMEDCLSNECLKLFCTEHEDYAGKEKFLNCQKLYEEGVDGAAGALALFYTGLWDGGPGPDCDMALMLLEEGLKGSVLEDVFDCLIHIGSGRMDGEGQERALSILQNAYADGLTAAGIALARILIAQGRGEKMPDAPSYKQAFCLLEEIMAKGNGQAHILLARMYMSGQGVRRDLQKALAILRSGIDTDTADCAEELALLYFEGGKRDVGWKRDFHKAFVYAQNAVEYGSVVGYAILGILYSSGQDVPRNKKKAREYFLLGHAQCNAECAMQLARMLTFSAVWGNEEAKKQQFQYYWDAFRWGEPRAILKVAEAYYYGYGVEIKKSLAFSLFKNSAAAGFRSGAAWLATCYSRGIGVERDRKKAKEYEILSKTLPYE